MDKMPAKKKIVKKDFEKVTETIAIVALILNLILPGIGSIVGKRWQTGVIQLVLFLIGIPLWFIIIGFFLQGAVWIWALITGIDIVRKAQKE